MADDLPNVAGGQPDPVLVAQAMIDNHNFAIGQGLDTQSSDTGQLQAPAAQQALPQVANNVYQPPSGPPQMGGMPLIAQYLQGMIRGPQQGPQPVGTPNPSRGDMTLNFLGQFLSNMSAGLAAGGHGPGANERAAGAAMQAPYQRALQNYQVQQQAQKQQADIEAEKTRTQAAVAAYTAQPRFDPATHQYLGTMTDAQFTQYVRGQGAAGMKPKPVTDPIKQGLSDANALLEKGDIQGFTKKLDEVRQMKMATAAPGKDNEISLIQKANAGDKDALAAWNKLQQGRMQVRAASQSFKPMTYYDPDLQRNITLNASEAEARQKAGQTLIPSGPVSATTILQMQRAQNAIPAAIKEVSDNLDAWDDPTDRAIFARVMKETPMQGDQSSWFGNVLDQAAQENLSDKGKNAIVRLRRLNESLGTLRAISGLPATTGSMAATAALLPGATTPNSKMAKDQLNQIQKLVEQETGVPFMGAKSAPQAPKGGALDRLAKKYLK